MTIKILALDSSTNACSVALLVNNEIIENYQLAPKQHNEILLPMISKILADAGLKFNQLDAIAFGAGPGSFTGIRIAASVTQGLAFGADLPVIPISTLQALAQGAYSNFLSHKVISALDAKMHEIYFGAYKLNANGLMQEVISDDLLKPTEIPTPPEDEWIGVGDGFNIYGEILQKVLGNKLIHIEANFYPHAADIAKLALTNFQAGKILPPEQALPVYLRNYLFKTQNI